MTEHASQRTLRESVGCIGVGLHTGARVALTLRPAAPGTGLVFVRTDGPHPVEIPARGEFVIDAALATTLGRGGVKIATVEHVLAALAGLGVDNCRVEVDGPEVPIMDGSAEPFVRLVHAAGLREQAAPRRYLAIRRPVTVTDGDKSAALLPAARFGVTYTIDFQHPLISDQSAALELDEPRFVRELASARTFGFKRDVERLQRHGLALGGSLENAIVVDDFSILNPEGLRFPDEFVRHKILDAIGDLALIGMPVLGRLVAVKSGHALNHELVRAVLAEAAASEIVEHDVRAALREPAPPAWRPVARAV